MRFRTIYMVIGSLLTLAVLFLSDPDSQLITSIPYAASTLTILIVLMSSILYVALLHLSRRALMDYLDLSKYFAKALQTSEGSGLAIIGVGLIMISVAIVILAATS